MGINMPRPQRSRSRGLLWLAALAAISCGRAPAATAAELVRWLAEAVAPLALPSLDGPRQRLADHRDKLVLVHFFATWCEPCREELPRLAGLANALAELPVIVIAVDVGEPEARVRRFFESNRVTFPILLDADQTARKAWRVDVLPSTFVLAPGLCPSLRVDGDLDWRAGPIVEKLRAIAPPPIAQQISEACNTKGERP